MCESCQQRKRDYDWARDGEGKPKITANGSYMMVDDMGAYYGFTIDTLEKVRALLDEIEQLHD